MRVSGIVANLAVPDIAAAHDFYTDYLGLSVEGFNLGWVAHYQSPDGEAHVQLVTRDATAPNDSVISVHVGSGVEEAYGGGQAAWVRDRSPTDGRGVGCAEVLRPCPRWQCDQHGEPQRRVGSSDRISGRRPRRVPPNNDNGLNTPTASQLVLNSFGSTGRFGLT
jgi:catechol 2,3-dioxygenase-like lactoylglutathione lyase family enzyme